VIPDSVPLQNLDLFRLAMRHRSATVNSVAESYERLEFFGDSVLGLVVAQYLYEQHPDWDQGMLSKAKSSVVQEGPLAETASRLGFDAFLELSPGEESTGGRQRPSILADVFEATIGAIYLESGLEKAHDRRFQVQVLFDDEVMGEGAGRSKKEAEQAAAQDALELIERARRAREAFQAHFD
jgi:ribonuclease III